MAILTTKQKKLAIEQLIADFDSSTNAYYIGIGRSEDWNDSDVAPTAQSHLYEEEDFRDGLQSVKKVIDRTFIVPRYNWSSGAIYSAYDDKQIGYPTQTYYVMNDNNQIYICLQQSKDATGNAQASTVQPTGNTTGAPFATADGYIWKFSYSISAIDANKFVAANFIPVKLQTATDSSSQASDIEQFTVQNNSRKGEILGFAIDSGGAGYTSNPTLTVNAYGYDSALGFRGTDSAGGGGRLTGTKLMEIAKGGLTISGGIVVKAEIIDSSGTLMFGSGQRKATVTVSGGGSPTKPASVRPIIGCDDGMGADPRDDLKSTGLMMSIKATGSETTDGQSDFVVGNDFRTVGIIRNPLQTDSSANGVVYAENTGLALKKLKFSSVTQAFTSDNRIKGATSNVEALIDRVDSSNVFYHQTRDTGYGDFATGESISEINGNGAGLLDSSQAPFIKPEIDTRDGEILYIDNRASVTRASDQTEDIKVVIQI